MRVNAIVIFWLYFICIINLFFLQFLKCCFTLGLLALLFNILTIVSIQSIPHSIMKSIFYIFKFLIRYTHFTFIFMCIKIANKG